MRRFAAAALLAFPLLTVAAEPSERRPWGEWESPRKDAAQVDGHLGRYNPWSGDPEGSDNPLREPTRYTHPWQRLSQEPVSRSASEPASKSAEPIWRDPPESRRNNSRAQIEEEPPQRFQSHHSGSEPSEFERSREYRFDSLRESRRTLSSDERLPGLRERIYALPSAERSRNRRDHYADPDGLERWFEERDEAEYRNELRYRPRSR